MIRGALPDFDIVIATRNRADALRMSIPLMLNQSAKPQSLIVVDSSDDHAAVCRAIESAICGFSGRVEVVASSRGSSYQRNVGLKYVREPIVFFPDDDSMFYPGASEEILKIYQADSARDVGGVCTAEAFQMPGDHLSEITYRTGVLDNPMKRLLTLTRSFERKFAPDPLMLTGQEFIASRAAPGWLAEHNAVLVEYMTGFRMTFRTESIAPHGFNELFINYGLCEDVEASLSVLKNQHLVGARNARIYHHKFPGARSGGRFFGVAQMLNRAYIVAKLAPQDSNARRSVLRYNAYTVARHSRGALTSYGRAKLMGALAAARCTGELLQCPSENLADCYRALWEKCTAQQAVKPLAAQRDSNA